MIGGNYGWIIWLQYVGLKVTPMLIGRLDVSTPATGKEDTPTMPPRLKIGRFKFYVCTETIRKILGKCSNVMVKTGYYQNNGS